MITLAAALLLSTNLIDERLCVGKVPHPVSLTELNEKVDAWIGRCVTVGGRFLAGSLVEGEDRQIDGLPRLRLGLYEREGVSARSAISRAGGDWEVTGAVDSCERIAAGVRAQYERQVAEAKAAGKLMPAPIMLAGPCHSQGGPVLWISSYRRPNAAK